jgi:hypothetical protein
VGKLHYEELRDLYPSPSMFRVFKAKEDEMGSACSICEKSNACRVLGVKVTRNRSHKEARGWIGFFWLRIWFS